MVRPGAVVIDVGINRVDDPSLPKGYRLVRRRGLRARWPTIASAITPVPGGVGPMTIAMLLANTLQADEAAGWREPSREPPPRPLRSLGLSYPEPCRWPSSTDAPDVASRAASGSRLGAGRGLGSQGLPERPLVLHPARRRGPAPLRDVADPRREAARRRRPTAPRSSSAARPRCGRSGASSGSPSPSCSSPTRLGPAAAGAGADPAGAREGRPASIPPGSGPLPALPRRIAVVTSLDGAALRDIITVTRKRWPAVELVVVGTKVQGDEAEAEAGARARAGEPASGHRLLHRRPRRRRPGGSGGVQHRGGLPRARRRCGCRRSRPSATRPTSRFTDLVADLRAATPSAAAELAVPDRADARAAARPRSASRLAGGLAPAAPAWPRERLARTGDRLEAALAGQLERPPAGPRAARPPSSTRCRPSGCWSAATAWRRTPRAACSRRRGDFAPGRRLQPAGERRRRPGAGGGISVTMAEPPPSALAGRTTSGGSRRSCAGSSATTATSIVRSRCSRRASPGCARARERLRRRRPGCRRCCEEAEGTLRPRGPR